MERGGNAGEQVDHEAGFTATLTARLEMLHADGAVCEELVHRTNSSALFVGS